ncbi:flagellar hook-associated protein 1 FlgK [Pseudorhizobium tarimense]|uniref:Flagellar hook-associated protein 1 n=1 Tax=Pseudorhizobium tarimense TaxID=1079109 RepID=A0ABV2HAN4_9HYPH|nr:flagellar hook-associated protein FlgK [Pseudorhizobium tarimense]MCJ8520841.1 flagellar hook-associated protein FlgK [Pseudorhizobium tarimense]
MTLSSALNTAQSIFNNTGIQTGVTSKNIANAQNANYVRRSAVLMTGGNGALVVGIERSQNQSLFRQTIETSSLFSGQQTLLAGLEEIKSLMGGNDYETSPSVLIGNLRNNLQTWASKPSETTLGATVVSSAQDLVNGLNNASNELQAIRKRADDEIKQSVDSLNNLLSQFEVANNKVKQEVAVGGNPNDALDERDTLLKQISEIVGITTVRRENEDLALYTTDGTVLFETVPRTVSFTPTSAFGATTVGGGIYIDGIALKTGVGADTSAKGSLQALVQLRDEIVPEIQSQLDEIARGLIVAFAEKDPADPATLPTLPGLFTWDDSTAMPAGGVVEPGLASRIKVNPVIVPPTGDPNLIRDGGINGLGYVLNNENASGFSERLNELDDAFDVKITMGDGTEIGGSFSVLAFAANSIGWLEMNRSGATTAAENKLAMLSRATDAYSSETGVSLDEELSLLLDIEQSYKAAAKLMSTVDTMMQALLEAAS